MCLEASRHLRRAHMLEDTGEILSAAREYQSAIGFYAPFNPYSRCAAIEMAEMIENGITSVADHYFYMDEVAKAAELDILSSKVIMPYVVMAVVLGLLAVMIRYSALPDINTEEEDEGESDKLVH